MARTRNIELNSDMIQQIKATARALMADHGTAGISIRGIAKVLNVSPPALYHYFAKLDDLITALIVENFNALADALESAAAQSAATTYGMKVFDVFMAYRAWALTHPVDFQLIYGNPIPNYVAPRDVTVPAVVRTFIPPVALIEQALQTGECPKPPTIEPPIHEHIAHLITDGTYPISIAAFYITISAWTQIHGLIMLELFGHLTPNVGDPDAFYRSQVRTILRANGIISLTH